MKRNNLINFGAMLVMCVVPVLFYIGCSGTRETAAEPSADADSLRDAALERYINGQLFDQKGDWASAILEYQDALRFYEEPSIYFAIAKDYSNLGKNDQAIEAGKNAVRLEPRNLVYRDTLALIYARARKFDDALTQYREIIAIDSMQQGAWYNYAGLLQIVDPMKSLTVCEQIIDRFGPDEDIYFQMLQLYSIMGKNDKAIEVLKGMLALDPTNFEIKKSLGDLYLDIDSVDTALQIYQELEELNPTNVILRASIAHAYLVKHDLPKAREQFDSLIIKDTLSIEDQLEFGKVFISFVEKDSAVIPFTDELFTGMAKQYPDDWRPFWLLGAVANVKRDDSMAVVYFKKVTELAKWNPDGWVGVASVWFDKGESQKALDVLEEARKNVKDEFRVEFIYGLTLQRMKRTPEAALALERAIAINPRNVDALSALGLVYDELKRPADSDTVYERALRINPRNHTVLNNYGYSLAERNVQLDRAEKMVKEAVNAQPNNASYLDSMGWVYFRLGNYEEAEKYITKAIEQGNTNAVLFEHLGDVYSKMNKKEKAQEYWKKALELDGSNQALKNKIERGSL